MTLLLLSIFVDADVDLCVNRLKERNKCIPGYSHEEIEIRCDIVDGKNAITVTKSKSRADLRLCNNTDEPCKSPKMFIESRIMYC